MSCYFTGKSWRYDFWFRGQRYTEAKRFQTKWEAERAQALRKEELRSEIKKVNLQTPASPLQAEETAPEKSSLPVDLTVMLTPPVQGEIAPAVSMPEAILAPAATSIQAEQVNTQSFTENPANATDMAFLDLVNARLDWLKQYRSGEYYRGYLYLARRWIGLWGDLLCSQITSGMVASHLEKRKKKVSEFTANKDRRYLRAVFRFGILTLRCKLDDPTFGIPPYQESKEPMYIPSVADLDKVIAVAGPADKDYLLVVRETVGRVGEINQFRWQDVDFNDLTVTLYTRKTRGGNRVPRNLAMTERLYEVLERLYSKRDLSMPWVFWHRYWSRKKGKFVRGPYKDRNKLMRGLCKKAGVRYFRFHPIRHQGASVMAAEGAPLPEIQKWLGHVNAKTTEGYLHGLSEDARRPAERLEAGHKRLGAK